MVINKGIRIINYIIDVTCIIVIFSIVNLFINSYHTDFLYYSIFITYYFVFEFYIGQTIGKLITKTVVVDQESLKPTFKKILFRTILRLNPFDGVSYLFGLGKGAHDLISKTELKVK